MDSLVSLTPSPEIELERKEQAPIRKRLKSKIPGVASRACATAPADRQLILSFWIGGDTLKEIAEKTGIPLSTVQKKLKKIQKDIIKGLEQEITEETGEAIPEKSWLMKVLKKIVKDRGQLGQLLAKRPGGRRARAPRPQA